MMPEYADRKFVWTDDMLTLTARSELAVKALIRSATTDVDDPEVDPIDTLLWVVGDQEPEPMLAQEIYRVKERLAGQVVGRIGDKPAPKKRASRERRKRRYREDADYRERLLAKSRAARKTDEHRARDAARKRAARARNAA